MNHTFSMEAEEDDEELGELCAEILENWNTPSPFYTSHHNPFSLEDDVQTVARKRDATCLETDISMSKLKKYNDLKQNTELEDKDERGKGSKYEEADENSYSKARNEPSIVPVLVADTFYDKLLQRYVDGVNIASLSKVQDDNAHENEAESGTVSANGGKRIEKLGSAQVSSLFKSDFPTVKKMLKRSPVSGEHRHMQATCTVAPVNFRRGFVTRYVPPRSKTIFDINIEEIGEKVWRNPGADISDFFNYGLDEKQWKDYCKLMQGQRRIKSYGQRKKEDESTQSPKVAMHNSSHENDIRRQQNKENRVSTADQGAILHPHRRNTPYMNCRMTNRDRISPFPRDSYLAEDREWKEEQSQQNYDVHFTTLSRERKSDLLITHSEVELTGTDEMGKKQSSRNQEDHSPSQRSLKRARFYKGNQTSYHKVDLYLAESSCSPRVESVREKREYYVSQGVQREYADRTFPTNIHNSGTIMKVEEDTEKLKRRKERFFSPMPILRNVVADTSMEIETTHFKNGV